MAKRFISTDIFKEQFVKSLQSVHKLFFFYLMTDCDHAGIWNVELDVAELRIGESLNEKEVLNVFGEKIIVFDDGKKWFIPSFIKFQYGELRESVNAHKSVIRLLKFHGLHKYLNPKKEKNQQFMNSSQTVKDMDKDKDKDIIVKENHILIPTKEEFIQFAVEKSNDVDVNAVKLLYTAWKENDWRDSNQKKIKRWKYKLPYALINLPRNKPDPQNNFPKPRNLKRL